jgi:hypothetical protein
MRTGAGLERLDDRGHVELGVAEREGLGVEGAAGVDQG